MTRTKLYLLYLIAIIAMGSCSSGKSAFEHGNYYDAVMTSVNRLRRNDDHEKSIETLRQAYPMAVAFYEDKAKAVLASNAEFKWTSVIEYYSTINVMYDEIRRSPGALKVIPSPVNYYSKLEEAKKNAAEENYSAGILAMTAGTRDKAKVAYGLFIKANGFVPGYKDVLKMTETALWNATVKVVMEPIPVQSKNIAVSAEFFDDKVSEYLHASSLNQFVKFYTRKEAQTLKLNPDHVIKIEFDEFAVGQVFMNEKEMKLERDSIVVGQYVSQSLVGGSAGSGNSGGSNNTGGGNPGNSGGNAGGGNTGSTPGNSGNTGSGNTGGNTGGSNNSGGTGGGNNPGSNTGDQDTVKVIVCHIPPGNAAAKHTLVISRSALKAHLGHGDKEGACDEEIGKDKPKDGKDKPSDKPKDEKPKDDKDKPKDNSKSGGKPQASNYQPLFFASVDNDPSKWLAYQYYSEDTVKVYTTVKATLYYYKKTTTSKGVISFRIIDAKTNALLSVEKMPGEYVWISEWATFNGDERALTPEQLKLTKFKEKVPPPAQDLFIEFTRPIYDQLITKIRDFYKNY